MNICKICGQPCGIYEICRECQKDLIDEKVSLCHECGNYYFTDQSCPHCKNQQDNQNKTNEHSNTTIDNPSTQVQENDIKYTDQQSPSTVNIKIENEDKSTPFKDGVGKGFGTGCGCLLSILAALTILALILSEMMS